MVVPTLSQWSASVIGRYIDVDVAAGPQCWDLVQDGMTTFGLGTFWTKPGAPNFGGWAAGAVEGFGLNGLEKVFTLHDGREELGIIGDVVVWSAGNPSYPDSHTAWLMGPDDGVSDLDVLSQNSSPADPSAPGYPGADTLRKTGTSGPVRRQYLPREECWFLRPITTISKEGGGIVPFNLDGIAVALRKYGVPVIEEPGWQTRGYAAQDLLGYGGVLWHHTASNRGSYAYNVWPSGPILVDGRSDLPGPLCNLSIDRNGVVRVVATGVANHAGTGYAMGIVPKDMGNHWFAGVEIESSGVAPFDLTPRMMATIITVGAVLELTYGQSLAPENRLQPLHLEYSDAGKIDLFGWPGGGDGLRASINDTITQITTGGTLPSAPTPAPPPATSKDWLDMASEADVRRIVAEEIKKGAGPAVWNHPINNRMLKRNENAETILGSNEDRIVRQQLTPLRQDTAKVLAVATDAKTAARAGNDKAAELKLAVAAIATQVGQDVVAAVPGLDEATVTGVVSNAVDKALTGLVIRREEV